MRTYTWVAEAALVKRTWFDAVHGGGEEAHTTILITNLSRAHASNCCLALDSWFTTRRDVLLLFASGHCDRKSKGIYRNDYREEKSLVFFFHLVFCLRDHWRERQTVAAAVIIIGDEDDDDDDAMIRHIFYPTDPVQRQIQRRPA